MTIHRPGRFLAHVFPSIAVAAVMLLVACNLQIGGPAANTPAGVDQAVQQTFAALTQAAGGPGIEQAVQQTLAAQTAVALAVQQTVAAAVTNTPEFTLTPTFTLTPEAVHVSVSTETNCRSGPGPVYDKLGFLKVGETAEVVGRNSVNDTWIIKLPSNPAITCWLWGQYATVIGNWQALPVIPVPPTPTPAASFMFAYSDTQLCPAVYWWLNFRVTNSGSVTWKSYNLKITDSVTAVTQELSTNTFSRLDVCAETQSDGDLAPGEWGYGGYAFLNDPAGHSISAVMRICSEDALGGTCLEKSITFTP